MSSTTPHNRQIIGRIEYTSQRPMKFSAGHGESVHWMSCPDVRLMRECSKVVIPMKWHDSLHNPRQSRLGSWLYRASSLASLFTR
jgi:hypothetical protein